ncbi:NlpC/P60 family protein [Rhodobacteraceae bacterium KMM 6894]|nr:NlpC/P60 family protein [Rhodobacteraceae bacterium KMM 6894]
MTRDPRLTPANARVAYIALRGQVDAPRYSSGAARQVGVPVADLLRAPGGKRERQLLMGAPVTRYDTHDGWSFVQAEDGYVGYLPDNTLADGPAPTHHVIARATHVYSAPDLKTPERAMLSHGARLTVLSVDGHWAETPIGHVPAQHLAPLSARAADPVTVALLYLGTPYLWGGNSAFGIDCSGLVQAGCRACGIDCPGDSDLQEAALGTAVPPDAGLRRGDLIFWRGHVAWVLDGAHILHANAHAMAVSIEPMEAAIARIQTAGDPVTSRKRLIDTTGDLI